MKQTQKILRHLQDYGSITPMEAMKQYGIMRLAARINDLRNDGYSIQTVNESGENRYGESTRWARYSL